MTAKLRILHLVFPFIILLIFTGCSRQKNTVVSRNYHKLTARDNGYFNARELVKAGTKTLAESHTDQYDRLLKIFRYATEEKAKAIFPDMDEAIKKTSIVVQRHSMVFDGHEKNRWVEESYLIIGKAQFLKHDYWAAVETFQFVASSYNKSPIRFDGLLWLTQCYLELGKTPDAEYLLDFLKNDKEFPWKKLRGEYYAISANFYIQKENYERAAEELKNAIASTKKKYDRIRYMFILGQLYQKTEKFHDAFAIYDRVIKHNAPYDMEFNARINRARCSDVALGVEDIKKQLHKMIKDEKNQDFLDRIYYALATIALKENKEDEAINYLNLSVKSSTTNTNQKALSYLELAEIFFRRPDYREAQVYYDSTVAFLSPDHPDYDLCFSKKSSLTRLVKYLNIIAEQDSMLVLSNLSISEQQAAVNKIIAAEIEEQERIKKEEEEQKVLEEQQENGGMQNQGQFIPNNPKTNTFNQQSGGGWYFYNPSALSFGLTEFTKKWGNRKLEDNWRRSEKELAIMEQQPEEEAAEDSTDMLAALQRDSIRALDNEKRRDAYLASIPGNDEQKNAATAKIIDAYYNAGLIYKEQLRNYLASVDNFLEMLRRFPDNKYLLPVYFNLYRNYLALKDTAKADVYKDILLTKYPDSEYSKIILNPNYFQENQKKTAILQVFYENTYRAYLNGQYEDVIKRKSQADSLFPPNKLTPKFEFLKALAVGKARTIPEFEASLKTVVMKFPQDSVSVRAQEILDLIAKGIPESGMPMPDSAKKENEIPKPGTNVPAVPYVLNADTVHYFIVAFPQGSISVNDLKVKMSDYNTKFYSTSELQITDAYIGTAKQFIMVRSFANAEAANNYMTGIIESPDVFDSIDINTVQIFLITPNNMLFLMQTKDTDGYNAFFKLNYLEQ
ncbi:MAG: hypothetical protein ACHQNT_09260 [Bacteroidia bacterium]